MIGHIVGGIGKLLRWRKELPTPIYYMFIRPKPQILPQEVAVNAGSKSVLWSSLIGIENMSDKVLKDIRIKIPTKILYDPIVQTGYGMTLHAWEFDRAMNEVKVSAIDPQEAIYTTIFPIPSELKHYTKPKVIVGDQLLNNSMHWRICELPELSEKRRLCGSDGGFTSVAQFIAVCSRK